MSTLENAQWYGEPSFVDADILRVRICHYFLGGTSVSHY
jgi:hypothetical protein